MIIRIRLEDWDQLKPGEMYEIEARYLSREWDPKKHLEAGQRIVDRLLQDLERQYGPGSFEILHSTIEPVADSGAWRCKIGIKFHGPKTSATHAASPIMSVLVALLRRLLMKALVSLVPLLAAIIAVTVYLIKFAKDVAQKYGKWIVYSVIGLTAFMLLYKAAKTIKPWA